MREKQLKALRRKARQLGLELVEKTSGSDAPAEAASVQGRRRGTKHPKRWAGGGEKGQGATRENSPSDRFVALAGESARRGKPGKKITSVR